MVIVRVNKTPSIQIYLCIVRISDICVEIYEITTHHYFHALFYVIFYLLTHKTQNTQLFPIAPNETSFISGCVFFFIYISFHCVCFSVSDSPCILCTLNFLLFYFCLFFFLLLSSVEHWSKSIVRRWLHNEKVQ